MRLYLDVDEVLLGKDGSLARHVMDFLAFVTDRFDCFWLTTHVREHDTEAVIQHLLQGTPDDLKTDLMEVIDTIRPAPWPRWKTDALPEDGDFRWLDDSPTATEIDILRERGWLGRWLHVDVDEDVDDLLRAQRILQVVDGGGIRDAELLGDLLQ